MKRRVGGDKEKGWQWLREVEKELGYNSFVRDLHGDDDDNDDDA